MIRRRDKPPGRLAVAAPSAGFRVEHNATVHRLELFLFRYRDPRTGKWVRALYRSERREIAARYVEYEIISPAEIREIDPDERRFCPHGAAPGAHTSCDCALNLPERTERAVRAVDPGSLGELERFLLLVFLRRYVTYCARHRRFAAMSGAARLHAAISACVGEA